MKHFGQLAQFVWAFLSLWVGLWCYGADEPIIKLGNGVVGNAQFSPDGNYLAILNSVGVEILNAQNFEEVAFLAGTITDRLSNLNLAFSPDGQLLSVAPGNIWNMTDFKLVHTFPETYYTFIFSPDGRFLVTGGREIGESITVWEVGKWEVAKQFKAPGNEELTSVDISPDGRLLAAGFGGDGPPPDLNFGTLIIWDFESGEELHRHKQRLYDVSSVDFSPDGTNLVYSGFRLTVLEVGMWQVRKELMDRTGYPAAVAFDPKTGNVAYPNIHDAELRSLDDELIQTFSGHAERVRSISIRPDSAVMATTSLDGSAKLWDMETGEEIRHRDYSSPIAALLFRKNNILLSCSEGTRNVRKWKVAAEEWETILPATQAAHSPVFFHPTEPLLATKFFGTVQLWDVSEGKLRAQPGMMRTIHLSFSYNGPFMASVDVIGKVEIWNYENLRIIAEFNVPDATGSAFGADGLIAIGTWFDTQLWDWKAQKLKWKVPGRRIAFSPNGKFLAASNAVWKIPQQQEQFQLLRRAAVLAFSADSGVLATIPEGKETIELWNTANGQIIRTLTGAQNVTTLAFSPGGKFLAGSGYDGIIKIWEVNVGLTAIESKNKAFFTWGRVKKSSHLQNFPNPFNPETWIPFTLAEEANVTLKIYDVSGELVRTIQLGTKPAGKYVTKETAAYWDGRNQHGERVASGAYFYTITARDFSQTRKALIQK
jgi:WD40 repeat protein